MHVAVLLGFYCGFVCGTFAQNITCTATVGLGHTTYSIPYVPEKFGTNCSQDEPLGEYSWANASDTGHSVIAHHKGQNDGLARSNSISTLITSMCFDWIIYDRRCVSEDIHFTVNCTINCSENALAQKSSKETLTIVVVAVSVLLVLVIAFLIWKFKIHKKIYNSCKHTRDSYTPGRTDEEEGHL